MKTTEVKFIFLNPTYLGFQSNSNWHSENSERSQITCRNTRFDKLTLESLDMKRTVKEKKVKSPVDN